MTLRSRLLGRWRRRPSGGRSSAPLWLVPVAAPLLLMWRGLTGSLLLAPGDGYNYYLPLHVHAARLWREGVVPAWNSLAFSGSPLLAVNQPAVFYPPNLLFLVLPAATANNLAVIINYVVAGLGAHLLTRRLTGDPVAGAVAGVAFGLSGFMVGHLGHQSIIASASWLPWTILGLELLIERVTPLRLLGGGATVAFAVVAGHPQMFSINLFALGVYGVARAAGERRVRPAAVLAAMVAAGCALAAVQLLPTLLMVGESDRSRLSFEEAVSFSFDISHLPLLVFPYLFGNIVRLGPFTAPYQGDWALTELTGYVGSAAAVLAVAGAAALIAHKRDRTVIALVVTGLLALIVAAGDSTPVSRLVHAMPVYGQFRNWGRFVVVVDLVVAVLAGYAVAHLRSTGIAGRRRAAAWSAGGAALVVIAAVVVPDLDSVAEHAVGGRPRFWALAVPVAFAVLAAGVAAASAAIRDPRWSRLVVTSLIAVVGLDMALSFGAFYEWKAGWTTVEQLEGDLGRNADVAFGPVPDAGGGIDRYIVGGAEVGAVPDYVNISMLHETPSANGFDPLAPDRYLDSVGGMLYYGGVTRPDDLWRDGSDLLDLLRVTLVMAEDDRAGAKAMPPEAATVFTKAGNPPVVGALHDPALPEAFVVGAVERDDPDDVAAAIAGHREFDPRSMALVEDECSACRRLDAPGAAGTASVRRHHDGRMTVEVRADRPGLLVVSEAYLPGWSASVDGRSAQALRADGVVIGVPVPAGRSTVELTYRAPGLGAGALITGVTLVALGLGAAVRSRGRQQDVPRRPSAAA